MTAPPPPAASAAGPVFLWDPEAGELRAFPSADAAARWLRPWQEVGALAAWDAEGRAVAFELAVRRVRRLGLWPARREQVRVRGVEQAPDHAAELRQVLVAALQRRGLAGADLAALPLPELVARAAPVLRR